MSLEGELCLKNGCGGMVMRKNKTIVLVISITIVLILGGIFAFKGCSKIIQKDKFVGVWYDEDGLKYLEIMKNGKTYKCQMYFTMTKSKGEKAALYEDGFIEEGYLIFKKSSRLDYGFEYKNTNEILMLTFFKPKSEAKPSECEKETDEVLTRGKK
jgi:hypothetical protein